MTVLLSTVVKQCGLKSGIGVVLLMAFLLLFPQVCAAGNPLRGSFLIASENTQDPRFQKSVILILEHGATGSVGLIINKPLPVTLNHAFSELPDAIAGDRALYFGGPVNPNVTWVLFQSADQPADAIEVLPEVFAANAASFFRDEDHKVKSDNIRIMTGYAGWAPGQLDTELKRGGWKVQPARAVDIFDEEPESLWGYLSGKGGLLI